MKSIHIRTHDFQKQNLVGDKDHKDTYTCAVCGCTGKRDAFQDYIVVTESDARKALKCTYREPALPPPPQTNKVIRTPWSSDLPNGTIIIFVREDEKGYWFKREDGKRVAGGDGTFVLRPGEYGK